MLQCILILLIVTIAYAGDIGWNHIDLDSFHEELENTLIAKPNKLKSSNLSCYSCSSLNDTDCLNVTTLSTHNLTRECGYNDQCAVVRIEYQTQEMKEVTFWGLERKCLSSCMPGCIILDLITGERTKLHYCCSCCDTDNCNTDSLSSVSKSSFYFIFVVFFFAIFYNKYFLL